MSSADLEPRQWRLYVRDMIDFCERVLSYTEGMNQDTFVGNALVYDATLRNLGLIGEAATRVPESVREAHPEIPWRAIIGARNRIIHVYLGIDDDIIWTIIQDDVPAILPDLRSLLQAAKQG